jgi:hypothetical protein
MLKKERRTAFAYTILQQQLRFMHYKIPPNE